MPFDRFSQGLTDAQEANVIATCEACYGDIYQCEDVLEVESDIIHDSFDCLKELTGARRKEIW